MLPVLSILIFNMQWMGWNILLAGLPFVLSYFLFKNKIRINILWIASFILFILFLPNAPYVITDIIHLYRSAASVNSFFSLLLLVFQYIIFILLGLILFLKSYAKFENFMLGRYKIMPLSIRIPSFISISIGVYLGRVLRLNSWDVFTRPKEVLGALVYLQTTDALLYVILFTGLLFGIYFLYLQVKH